MFLIQVVDVPGRKQKRTPARVTYPDDHGV